MTGNPDTIQTPERYDIRIARDGSWWHEGQKIERPGLIKLFASVLQRDEYGDFWLVTPAERGKITVEDAPFLAVEMLAEGKGPDQVLRFRTNLDEWVTAGPAHPLRFAGAHIYVEIRKGLEALLARSVYYELIELALADDMGIWSAGVLFRLEQT